MAKHLSKKIYKQQIVHLSTTLAFFLRKGSILGWLRFFVFTIMVITTYQVFVTEGLIGLIPVITGLGILLFLVALDVNNNSKISNVRTLLAINKEELRILQNDFHFRYDGSDLASEAHDYANDLDLFGKASLYQWINRCQTEQGRKLLATNLQYPLAAQVIGERHQAIEELSPMVEWRQQFQAYAISSSVTFKTQNKTAEWIREEDTHFAAVYWRIIITIYSCITILSAIAAILGYISASTFSLLFLSYLFLSIILSRNTIKPYIQLSGIVKEISTLQQLVGWIESKAFRSTMIQRLKKEVTPGNGSASVEIKKLKAILDRFDARLNIAVLLFLNSFLLWDVRQMIALNEWRKRNKNVVTNWFDMVADMEVLSTLAAVRFNNPGWCLPQIVMEHLTFHGIQVGHPLISKKSRIDNDFSLSGTGKIALVTGSNMAGKSTFLRTLGINIVLAQAGSPVCARQLAVSPVRLMSSMRIADNLAENTSTFYAELKKLKTIIEAVNHGEKVFILLDEILRGTNSLDRHTGSSALIAQLMRKKAVAVIATHDLELASLQQQYPGGLQNYHFDVQVENEELYFDYKLKEEVCTSMNASLLMKKIGIEV